jgi:hypothetical protein
VTVAVFVDRVRPCIPIAVQTPILIVDDSETKMTTS